MEIANQVRAYSYLSAVLANREGDPYCHSCNSFLSALAQISESMSGFEREHGAEIEKSDLSLFFFVARSVISGIKRPYSPDRQKKTGNCKLPAGVCFLTQSQAILQRMQQPGGLSVVHPFNTPGSAK